MFVQQLRLTGILLCCLLVLVFELFFHLLQCILLFVLFLVFLIGIFWFATNPSMGAGLTLSFIAGLSMIFLPCTLPMAFVIVPMTMGKAPLKGFLMAISFGLGLSVTLSIYGVAVAAAGEFFGLTATTQLMLVIGGAAALLFGLSEIKLIKFRLPSYSGKFPDLTTMPAANSPILGARPPIRSAISMTISASSIR